MIDSKRNGDSQATDTTLIFADSQLSGSFVNACTVFTVYTETFVSCVIFEVESYFELDVYSNVFCGLYTQTIDSSHHLHYHMLSRARRAYGCRDRFTPQYNFRCCVLPPCHWLCFYLRAFYPVTVQPDQLISNQKDRSLDQTRLAQITLPKQQNLLIIHSSLVRK